MKPTSLAQWPEGWMEYHKHGLESLVMSGRVSGSLFSERPNGSADQILGAFPKRDPEVPWIYFVAGGAFCWWSGMVTKGQERKLKGLPKGDQNSERHAAFYP